MSIKFHLMKLETFSCPKTVQSGFGSSWYTIGGDSYINSYAEKLIIPSEL